MTLTHNVLTNCSTVETLDVFLDYGGCEGRELDGEDFPFSEENRYPALKGLKLDG